MGYNDSSTSPNSSPDNSSYYQSPLSVSDLCSDNVNSDLQMHIDKDDPDVQLAAEALGSMARGFPITPTGMSNYSYMMSSPSILASCAWMLSCKNFQQLLHYH